jgi:hypothetical protein
MKQYACVAMWALVGVLSAGVASAQTSGSAGTDTQKMSAEIAAGPTLGHKGSSYVTGEFAYRVANKLDVFVEGGYMANVGTQNLDTNAATLLPFLSAVGGGPATVASSGIKVGHFDAGVKYWIDPIVASVRPYFLFSVGAASAKTEVNYAVNGTTIDPATLGVQLGGDLSGTQTKTIIVFGGGVAIPVAARYYVDLGYRFGGILSKVSDVENDTSIKTQRVILGFGIRF